MREDTVALQTGDNGVVVELSPATGADYRACYYEDYRINGKNEEYKFTCSKSLQCCGNHCCTMIAGMPIWVLILVILLFLLILLICCCGAWCCWQKRRPRKGSKEGDDYAAVAQDEIAVEQGRVVLVKRSGKSRAAEPRASGSTEPPSSEPTVSGSGGGTLRRGSTASSTIDGDTLPKTGPLLENKFVASPMEETFIAAPKPIEVKRHTEDELSTEQKPLLVRQDTPDQQKAHIIYHRSATDQVASYNLE